MKDLVFLGKLLNYIIGIGPQYISIVCYIFRSTTVIVNWQTVFNSIHLYVRIYYMYYLIRSNAADGQRTADG